MGSPYCTTCTHVSSVLDHFFQLNFDPNSTFLTKKKVKSQIRSKQKLNQSKKQSMMINFFKKQNTHIKKQDQNLKSSSRTKL
ncbi:hypothetical protein Hanom_Chr07g00607401 [Helianthus anomalus]